VHRSHAALAVLLLVAACKVERTPARFYNRQPAASDQDAAVAELRARVRAFGANLERGNPAAAVSALAPTADAVVFPLGSDDGRPASGAEGLVRTLSDLGVPAPLAARTPDLTVKANLKGNLGWFSTHLEMLPLGAQGTFERIRVSGAFVRDGGEWHLAQIHLSPAVAPPPPDTAAADTAAADSAARTTRRDSAGPRKAGTSRPAARRGEGG
jgi:hypothetical protein